jgi:hypothetical protein
LFHFVKYLWDGGVDAYGFRWGDALWRLRKRLELPLLLSPHGGAPIAEGEQATTAVPSHFTMMTGGIGAWLRLAAGGGCGRLDADGRRGQGLYRDGCDRCGLMGKNGFCIS